ncbi:MAG: phosphatidylinositol mannoside acyltransferase, partial [Actinomycetaceae bacterium]|nr:phosphatidylinositol mannoside acyltransferase [Actinomycetaceae bacterium]
QLRANQARFTDKRSRQLSARAMRSYMRYYYEAFRLPSLTEEQIKARVSVSGAQPLRDQLEHSSAIGALMHAGNWDLAGAWANLELGEVHTIAEKLEPEELYERFLHFRRNVGMTIYPLVKGGGALRRLEQDMEQPGCFVPLLADRDLTATGVEVSLGGHSLLVAPGPALLAIRTGRPIFPIFSSYENIDGKRERQAGTHWGMHLDICEPIYPAADVQATPEEQVKDIQRMSQEWISALEPYLHRHLEDWHMLQKVFVADLDPERLARARARAVERQENRGGN